MTTGSPSRTSESIRSSRWFGDWTAKAAIRRPGEEAWGAPGQPLPAALPQGDELKARLVTGASDLTCTR